MHKTNCKYYFIDVKVYYFWIISLPNVIFFVLFRTRTIQMHYIYFTVFIIIILTKRSEIRLSHFTRLRAFYFLKLNYYRVLRSEILFLVKAANL